MIAMNWTLAPSWNALPSGDHTSAQSLSACQSLAESRGHATFSFNTKSSHCYTSAAAILGGVPSDHVDSGCDASRVKYCRAAPGPAILPGWCAPQPDPKKALGGYKLAKISQTSLVHRGDKILGSYNHNVMFDYVQGSGFFMQV